MSDSEDNPTIPSDATLTRALKATVVSLFKSDNVEDLTVKRVRTKVEQELNLSEGFFKNAPDWNQKSKDIIHKAVVCLN